MTDAHRPGLILNAFAMGVGHHQAAWRHPLAPSHAAELDIAHFVELAQIAERGAFHSFFLADTLALNTGLGYNVHSNLEPLTTLAAVSQHTAHIGLVATASTAFYPPYHLARLINGLDHVSNGRFSWNVVTSATDIEARNFGQPELAAHDDRYRLAEDYVDTIVALLESWQPDAVVRDVETGIYADRSRVDFSGTTIGRFSVGGPLDQPRSPQGRPVLYQAGRSETGIAFAGRYADVVFSVLPELDEAAAFRRRLHAAAAAAGRPASSIKLVPGLWPFIGSTEREARQMYDQLEEHVSAQQAATFLSFFTGIDLSRYGFDEEIPPLDQTDFKGQQGRYAKLQGLVAEGHNTLRKLQRVFGSTRGHQYIVGTPEQIADSIIRWHDAEAVDGFSIQAPILPHGLDLFVDQVVPLLQDRGVFRREYPEGVSLRDQLDG